MTKEYNPLEHSVVQALLKPDAIHRYECDDFIEALISGLYSELGRCYWNWNQGVLENRVDWQLDTGTGFEYRRYYWGDDEENCELPNMKFGAVVINWYKHMGRGMSCNVNWSEKQWREWFDEAMKAIRLYDACIQNRHIYWRDLDAGRKPWEPCERVQCKDCKYCVAFGANALIWNRQGSKDVNDADQEPDEVSG